MKGDFDVAAALASQQLSLPPVPLGQVVDDSNSGSYGDGGFGSAHNGVVQFVMCDGSVMVLSTSVDGKVLDAMATRAGGDTYDINGSASPCQHHL